MKPVLISVIGILGFAAWAPFSAALPLNAPRVDIPYLQSVQGVGRAEVREAQSLLARLGYDAGVPDGISGSRTRAAVRAFQRNSELQTTGAISATLLNGLRDAVNRPPPPVQAAPAPAPQGALQTNRGSVTLIIPQVAVPVRPSVSPSAPRYSNSSLVLLTPSAPQAAWQAPKQVERRRPVSLLPMPSRQAATAIPPISTQPFTSQPITSQAPELASAPPPPLSVTPLSPARPSTLSPVPPSLAAPGQGAGAGTFGWDTPPPPKLQTQVLQVSAPVSPAQASPVQQASPPSLLAPQPVIVAAPVITPPAAMPSRQREPERSAIAPQILTIDRTPDHAPPPPGMPMAAAPPPPSIQPLSPSATQPPAPQLSQALPRRPQAAAPAPPPTQQIPTMPTMTMPTAPVPTALSARVVTPDNPTSASDGMAALPVRPQPLSLLASAPGFREAAPPPLGLSGITGQTWRFTDDNGAEMELLFEEDSKISGPAFAEAMTWSLEGGEMWLLYETALGGRSARRGRMSGPNAMTGQGESNRRGDHGETRRWTWRAVRVR